jgi:nicotinamidase-related amidase
VQGTPGCEFHPRLKLPPSTIQILKADSPEKDAYSGFEGTSLDDQLKHSGTRHLYVCGLATDYCVKQTVLDALTLGYQVTVLSDAIRAVNVQPDDGLKAIAEMKRHGAALIASTDENSLKSHSALIVVDVQNDFCPPSGALAVPEGDKVIDSINAFIQRLL